jgi:hypothetical protein
MKRLFTLIFIIVAGCSDDETKRSSETYTDLTGTWNFSNSDISGSFKIGKVNNVLAIASGNMVIKGTSYPVTTGTIELENTNYFTDLIITDGQGASVAFWGASHNSEYTEISAEFYSYYEHCDVSCEGEQTQTPIKVTR